MSTDCTPKEEALPKESTDNRGTVLLIDSDEDILFDYWYLFSRSGFNAVQVKHPEHILSLLINEQFDADLIVCNVSAPMMHWVDCLSMAKRSGGLQPNLQSIPVILYGQAYTHVDTSFATKYFPQKPEPKILLKTALAIFYEFQTAKRIKRKLDEREKRKSGN